jgi:anti-sigma-K factor RskA
MTDRHEPSEDHPDDVEIERLLRDLEPDDGELLELPADLFGLIAAEVAIVDQAPGSIATTDRSAAATVSLDDNVVSLDRRRLLSRRGKAVSAIAAAVLLIAGSMAIVAQSDANNSSVVATANLAYDADAFDELGANAIASVTLVDDDGTFHLEIDRSVLPSPTGESADLELWLIQPDADGNPADLVSLGVIDPSNLGDFVVPESHDPDIYFVVDISVEPRDGDAAHSGRSILRGPLTDT